MTQAKLSISGSFTDKNGWAGGIRRNQVLIAWDQPDARLDLAVDGQASLILVTKRSERPRPHVILLIASDVDGRSIVLSSGYRLYGSGAELERVAADPRYALDELIRRFGRELTINGGTPSKFIERAHVDAQELAFAAVGAGDDLTMLHFGQRVASGGFNVSYAWAIDEARYRAALSAN